MGYRKLTRAQDPSPMESLPQIKILKVQDLSWLSTYNTGSRVGMAYGGEAGRGGISPMVMDKTFIN